MTVNTNKSYKLVSPDGGFGYVICFATIVIMVPTAGFAPFLGMTYNDIMLEIGLDTAGIGLVSGVNFICLAISGFMTSPLLKLLSVRQLALVAAILYNVGAFCIPFTHNVVQFFFCLSFLQNGGGGILFNLVFTSLRNYFVKKRLLATSLVMTVTAVASMCVPMFIKVASEYYGHRGMLLIVSGCTMQTFIGVVLLQPVAWHMKKEEIQHENVTEMKTLLAEDKMTDSAPIETPVVNLGDIEIPSYNIKKDSVVKKLFKGIFDVALMKTFIPSYACIGIAIASFTDFLYILIMPRAFYSTGFSQQFVATSLSLIALGDLTTRITFIALSKWLMKIGSKQLHFIGVIIAFTARIGLLVSSDKTVMLVFLTTMGVGRSFFKILASIIIADATSTEKYSAAFGIYMVILGFTNFTLGPIIGAIRDYTDNYDIVFYISTALYVVVIAIWVIERYFGKAPEKKNQENP